MQLSKTTTHFTISNNSGVDLFKSSLDTCFLYYEEKTGKISINLNNSIQKFDMHLRDFTYTSVNELLVSIANMIFSDFGPAITIPSTKRVFPINEYSVFKENNRIFLIANKNLINVEFFKSKFNSDNVITIKNNNTFKAKIIVKEEDLNDYKLDLNDSYAVEEVLNAESGGGGGIPPGTADIPENYTVAEQDSGRKWINNKTIYERYVDLEGVANGDVLLLST